jgi:hypothetical protein
MDELQAWFWKINGLGARRHGQTPRQWPRPASRLSHEQWCPLTSNSLLRVAPRPDLHRSVTIVWQAGNNSVTSPKNRALASFPRAGPIAVAWKLVLWQYLNMKTTLEIADPLFRRIKARAAMEGLELKDVVASALNTYLIRPPPPAKKRARPCPFPLVRGKVGMIMGQLNNETIARLQEKEDFEHHRRSTGH